VFTVRESDWNKKLSCETQKVVRVMCTGIQTGLRTQHSYLIICRQCCHLKLYFNLPPSCARRQILNRLRGGKLKHLFRLCQDHYSVI